MQYSMNQIGNKGNWYKIKSKSPISAGSSNATGTSTRGEKKRKHEDSKKSRIAETGMTM